MHADEYQTFSSQSPLYQKHRRASLVANFFRTRTDVIDLFTYTLFNIETTRINVVWRRDLPQMANILVIVLI